MISKLAGHTGYLVVDHRNSPGLTPEFVDNAGKLGKPLLYAPEGKITEADTYTCPHCGSVILKNPLRDRPRNVCRKCMAYVCDQPSCNAGCLPLARIFDKAEQTAHKNPGLVLQTIAALRSDILGKP